MFPLPEADGMRLPLLLLFGGPSSEKSISLNSARSVYDHLGGVFEIHPVYVSANKRFMPVEAGLLYSGNVSDFEHKIAAGGGEGVESLNVVTNRSPLVFSVIHGEFGEDGEVQALLERAGVAYVGSEPSVCETMFDKSLARRELARLGWDVLPAVTFSPSVTAERAYDDFLELEGAPTAGVVKDTRSGSSIGVRVFHDLSSFRLPLMSCGRSGLEPSCWLSEGERVASSLSSCWRPRTGRLRYRRPRLYVRDCSAIERNICRATTLNSIVRRDLALKQ